MPRIEKLTPAPLPYPNGGGLRKASQSGLQAAEVRVMEARHELERLKLKQKHRQTSPRPTKAKKSA